MLIYVIRHGETDANAEGQFQGWTDYPLNENGRALAAITGQKLRGVRFDACFSSPLRRALETAEIVLRESGSGLTVTRDDRLKELNMGQWEGRKFRPGEREIPEEQVKLFFNDPVKLVGFPSGETIHQVIARTQEFLKDLAAREDGKTYLVSTHGFALRAMLNFLYENPSDFWHGHVPYNCAVNIIEVKNGTMNHIGDDKVYYDPAEVIDRYARY